MSLLLKETCNVYLFVTEPTHHTNNGHNLYRPFVPPLTIVSPTHIDTDSQFMMTTTLLKNSIILEEDHNKHMLRSVT